MDNSEFLVLIDNGHGKETLGKSSVDRSLLEFKWTREIADLIINKLKSLNIKVIKLVPEESDISLKERVLRANNYHKQNKKTILISLHCNAAGNGLNWTNAKGWTVWVAPNASANSKKLARLLYEEAEKRNLQGNRWVPNEKYNVKSLAMCRDTNCPAVLTENLFMDNKEDVEFLLSETGKSAIVDLHVDAILKYIQG